MEIFTPERLSSLQQLLDAASKILITCHKSPDGDAIGSALGLSHYLNATGHANTVLIPDMPPPFLMWMPGAEAMINGDEDESRTAGLISEADLIFCLDYNDLKRTGSLADHLMASDAPKVMIDHHVHPKDFAAVTISDTTSCSTAQLIYELAEARGEADKISNDAASCIYCGIVTDSGSFRFSSVQPKTHRIAANLIERGLDHEKVHRSVYDTNLPERLKLLGYALSNKLVVRPEFCTAYISLDQEELDAHDYRPGDTEGLVNYALSLQGVNMAVFIREGNNQVKLSLRSKGNVAVNEISAAHFEGGGHKNAAGGVSQKSVSETVDYLESILPQYADKLCNP